jgi:glycosyltransferase involved in cell wall biosynthesis
MAQDEKRKVMQVTWSFVAGGAEVYAFTIASRLNPQKYSSLMCALDQGGPLQQEIERLGIPCFVMNRRQGIDLPLMWKLYRLFLRHEVDVVHTHHFTQLFYSALGAKLAGARIIHTEHSVEQLKRKSLRIALRLISLLCDRVIAIGGESARALGQAGVPARKLTVICAGIDAARFCASRSESRRALGLQLGDRVASIVARLSPEKNHRLLLEAFAEVAARLQAAKLLIVGDGPQREEIREEIARLGLQERAFMLGIRRDLPSILAASDVFVLSSDREGLPVAALEAMAAAKPVVATSVGDLPLIVRHGETGLLVARRDRAALANALTQILSDEDLATRLGTNARKLVERNYSLQKMIERHEALYWARAGGRPPLSLLYLSEPYV